MITHPCDGHVCDRCATCLSGTCCLAVERPRPVAATAVHDRDARLRDAIVDAQLSPPSLKALVQVELLIAGRQPSALARSSQLQTLLANRSTIKEEEHGFPARTPRR